MSIFEFGDFSGNDPVFEVTGQSSHFDRAVHANEAQRTEERVSMSGDCLERLRQAAKAKPRPARGWLGFTADRVADAALHLLGMHIETDLEHGSEAMLVRA